MLLTFSTLRSIWCF